MSESSLVRLDSIDAMLAFSRDARAHGKNIGFVPTMGALHEGHRSLIRRARSENDVVVVSVFVNPLQFGPAEDFERYPRDLESDANQIAAAGGHALFSVSPEAMYPSGFATFVRAEGAALLWEGAIRPGHFRGVLTVVLKLFQLVKPQRAYFGRKDAQQLFLIERMARDLHLDLQIVPCATVREADGLAMSSRNAYLSKEERERALVLIRALRAAKLRYRSGERDAQALVAEARRILGAERDVSVDYLALVDPSSFLPCEGAMAQGRMIVAARVGKTRLLDNLLLAPEEEA